jgi:hypothetical protein
MGVCRIGEGLRVGRDAGRGGGLEKGVALWDSEGMWNNRDRRGFGLRVIGGKIKRYLH